MLIALQGRSPTGYLYPHNQNRTDSPQKRRLALSDRESMQHPFHAIP